MTLISNGMKPITHPINILDTMFQHKLAWMNSALDDSTVPSTAVTMGLQSHTLLGIDPRSRSRLKLTGRMIMKGIDSSPTISEGIQMEQGKLD